LLTTQDEFDTLRALGGYSLPKSHAAAFTVLVCQYDNRGEILSLDVSDGKAAPIPT